MYSLKEKQRAVELFHKHHRSASQVVRELGYPSTTMLMHWAADYQEGQMSDQRRSTEFKKEVVEAFISRQGTIQEVADKYSVSRMTLYRWRDELLREGLLDIPPDSTDPKGQASLMENARLRKQNEEQALQIDILEQVVSLLKKEKGIDELRLKNREKALIIDALRTKYSLARLLAKLQISKSSYFYQHKALMKKEKYEDIRPLMIGIFHQNYQSYGYRRMKRELEAQGTRLSEKVVLRLMGEEHLHVLVRRRRPYSSYAGELTPAPPNLIARDFDADRPNQKWLTDISEFRIPAGRIYLSPLIDCYDGRLVSWKIGQSPNAEMVTDMLTDGVSALHEGEYPRVHSDRGIQYRWPAWIDKMSEFSLVRSMSKKGCTADNAKAESLFGHLKTEFFYNHDWSKTTLDDFEEALNTYLNWYNTKRRKNSLGGKNLNEHRRCAL